LGNKFTFSLSVPFGFLVLVAGDALQDMETDAVAVGHFAQGAAVGAGKNIFRIITMQVLSDIRINPIIST
jgi:hypothetical protein